MRLRDGECVATDVSIYLKLRGGERSRRIGVDATDRTPAILHSITALYSAARRPQCAQHPPYRCRNGAAVRLLPREGQSLSLFDAQPNTES